MHSILGSVFSDTWSYPRFHKCETLPLISERAVFNILVKSIVQGLYDNSGPPIKERNGRDIRKRAIDDLGIVGSNDLSLGDNRAGFFSLTMKLKSFIAVIEHKLVF